MNLNELEPKDVWKNFFSICETPHPSHHEQALAKKIFTWAQGKGFEAYLDKVNNVIIRKKASQGCENVEGVILQAHTDMVPQAIKSLNFNFLTDSIKVRIDPEDSNWVKATDTTLGADDGMGVAIAMAILEDETLVHGPIECLFTVDEEDGMSGAQNLEDNVLKGKLLLNIDSEDNTVLTIGCAGAIRTKATMKKEATKNTNGMVKVIAKLNGLLGGHSGCDIHLGRGNATKVLAKIILGAKEFTSANIYIQSLEGGTVSNAIPRDAETIFYVEQKSYNEIEEALQKSASKVIASFAKTDGNMNFVMKKMNEENCNALCEDDSYNLLSFIANHIDGLIAMEKDIPNAIRTSLNLGVFSGKVTNNTFEAELVDLVRSSNENDKENITKKAEESFMSMTQHNWEVKSFRTDNYSAWTPDPESPLLKKCVKVYEELFGSSPKIESTHGGLEMGRFCPRFPDWQMISVGPQIMYPHSPDEKVNIESVGKVYSYVKAIITKLAK